MFVRAFKSAALAVALFGLSTAAGAATIFNFSFSAPGLFDTASGSGQLFAEASTANTFTVTGVAGTAKLGASSPFETLNAVSAAFLSSLNITGNETTGYTFKGIMSGPTTSYNFAKNAFGPNYTISNGLNTTTNGTFSLAVAPPAVAVPEAATWVMMIFGFGGIGMMLRTGKRRDRMQIAVR